MQLLVDINWPSKAIWKPALNNATEDVLLFEELNFEKGVTQAPDQDF